MGKVLKAAALNVLDESTLAVNIRATYNSYVQQLLNVKSLML